MQDKSIFFSYSRDNSDFVINLAKELRSAGAKIWLDQLDIKPGTRWDKSIEDALKESGTLLVVLSKSSVASNNVMDEVSYALEEGKTVVPVLLEECEIPFRLRRLQFADFTQSKEKGIATLTKALQLDTHVADKLEKDAVDSDMPKMAPKPKPEPPQQPVAVPKKKRGKGLLYGLMGAAAVIILIIVIPFGGEENTDGVEGGVGVESAADKEQESGVIETGEVEADEMAWNLATQENSIYSYLSYLYDTTTDDPHFEQATAAISSAMPNQAIAVFSDTQAVYFNNVLYFEGNQIKRDTDQNVINIPVAGNVLKAYFDIDLFDVNTQQFMNLTLSKGSYAIVESVTETTEDGTMYVYIRY